MKNCPNCNSEVEDHFDLCWNCQYSFSNSKILMDNEFVVICAACKAEIDGNLKFCPYCKHDLNALTEFDELGVPGPAKQIDCLRCNSPMSFNGNYQFHEGTRIGALGNIFELFTNRETFDLYFCPKCGKVELFLPELPAM